MAQPQMARITCIQCNAFYDSERELRDHMRTAHRQAGPEQPFGGRTGEQDEYIEADEEKEVGGEA